MRNRMLLLGICLAFVLATAMFAAAQGSQTVSITKGPTVENVTSNSATLAWSTNVNAGTMVKYGTDSNNLNQVAKAAWGGGPTHRVTLKNLEPNKTYFYQVTSAQGSGTGSRDMSGIETFKTSGGSSASAGHQDNDNDRDDRNQSGNNAGYQSGGSYQTSSNQGSQGGYSGNDQSQVVVGPIPQNLTDTSATIFWQTTGQAANIVKYGTSPNNLTQTARESGGGNSHHVELTGLQPDTMYYVAIMRQDGSVRSEGQFKTMPANFASQNANAVRITGGPNVDYLANNQAVISWSTNVPSSSMVKYGTDPNSMNQTAEASWGGTNHKVTLNNLNPNTKYWFQIQSAQGQGTGTMAATGYYTFQTIAPGQSAMTIPPQ